jgi:hypothetical protein
LFGFGQSLGKFLIEQGADEEILNHKKLPPRKVYLSGFGSLPALKGATVVSTPSSSGGGGGGTMDMDDCSEFMEEFVNYDDDLDEYDNFSTVNHERGAYTYDEHYQQEEQEEQEEETGGYMSPYEDDSSFAACTTPNMKQPPVGVPPSSPPTKYALASSPAASITPIVKRTTSKLQNVFKFQFSVFSVCVALFKTPTYSFSL